MAQTVILTGSQVKLYIAGKLYPEVQSISITTDYEEEEIYGIDSPFAQEIATSRIKVNGRINGVRVKGTGGTIGAAGRVTIDKLLSQPYTSIRIYDNYTQKDIYFIPQAKVSNETFEAPAKGVTKLSFNFKGIIPYQEVDLE